MHLIILGLILVVGILVYYIVTTSPGSGSSSDEKKSRLKKSGDADGSRVPEDLHKEGNVVFLPTAAKEAGSKDVPDMEEDAEDARDSRIPDVSGDPGGTNDADAGPDQEA